MEGKTGPHARLARRLCGGVWLPPAPGAPGSARSLARCPGGPGSIAEKRLTVGGRGHVPLWFRKGLSQCRARRKAFDLSVHFGSFPWFHLSVILPLQYKVSTFLLFLTFPWA